MEQPKFTPSQQAAIHSPGGPILVSAAAGSGKTTVLVARLMEQICDPALNRSVDDFLIITFTKKAAAELRGRIARELSERLAEDPLNRHLQKQLSRIYLAKISTVHSFCADLLREFALDLDLPVDFRVAEETECQKLRDRCVKELLDERYAGIGEDPALQTLVNGLGAGRDDRQIETLIHSVYAASQCRLYPRQWLQSCRDMLNMDRYETADQTPWGQALIQRLRETAQAHIQSLSALLPRLQREPVMEPYARSCEGDIAALRALASLSEWDEIVSAAQAGWSPARLPSVRKCPLPELQARYKETRSGMTDAVRRELSRFQSDSATVLKDLAQTSVAMDSLFSLVEDLARRYTSQKLRLHMLDFNDLEHGAVRLLIRPSDRQPTAAARELSGRFAEIMVDEYQDTNEVQDSIFRAISRQEENLVLVGDVKQSIYRFRMAEPGIFLEKYKTYPLYEPEIRGPQKILLSENFRSGPEILEAANAVFSACMSPAVGDLAYTEQEALRPGRALEPLPDPAVELWCLSTKQEDDDPTPEKAREEARLVARRIRALLDQGAPVRDKEGLRPIRAGDVVILMRTAKTAAAVYEEALQSYGIDCVSDLGESIFDSEELQTLESLLRLIDNAHQDIPLASVLLSPLFAVLADSLAKARLLNQDLDLYDALCLAAAEDPQLAGFLQTLDRLREQAALLPLHGLYEQILQQTELASVYGSMPSGAVRLERLRRFSELLTDFEDGGKRGVHQFLDYLDTLKENGVSLPQQEGGDAVRLMSVHKSKGLEFPVVVLTDLSHKFNLDDIRSPVQFHKDLGAACNVYDKETHTRFPSIGKQAINAALQRETISEEMRILYVAMTRAKDRLIMTYCSRYLDSRLRAMVPKLTLPVHSAVTGSVSCMGDWVLLTTLARTEAGELFAVGGHPDCASVSRLPWAVHYCRTAEEEADAASSPPPRPAAAPDPLRLETALHFVYPHRIASVTPAKLTATQLKGRVLDQEADDGQAPVIPLPVRLRKPRLMDAGQALTPAQRGTAMHLAMQYLDFEKTGSVEELRAELLRLRENAFLTPAQADAVSVEKLRAIFSGPIGQAIRAADRVIREFKFSILVDAETYFPQLKGEQVLLQGVTDCCLFKDGKLTVIDFKTDRVAKGQEAQASERYRGQLDAYSLALSRIFDAPVERKLLYFFATNAIVDL